MPTDGVVLDRKFVERLRKVLKWFDQNPQANFDDLDLLPYSGPNIQGVVATGEKSGDYYPGEVRMYNSTTETWDTLGEVWIREFNDENLTVGKRYPARQCGPHTIEDEERPVFMAFATGGGLGELGCGLKFDDENKLAVDIENLVGCGLEPDGECKIKIKPSDLVGCGLEADDAGCSISVKYFEKEVVVDFDEGDCSAMYETIAALDVTDCSGESIIIGELDFNLDDNTVYSGTVL